MAKTSLWIGLMAAVVYGWAQAPGQPPDRFPFAQYGKVGYIDRSGKVVIAPRFTQGGDFSEGLAAAWTETPESMFPLAGVINVSGNWVIHPQFDKIRTFHEGYAAAKLKDSFGTWALLSRSGGIVKVPSSEVFSDSMSIGDASEGLVSFSPTGETFGFMNTAGSLVVAPAYLSVRPFREGLANVCREKCGYIDVHGVVVVPLIYRAGLDFKAGKARVCNSDKCGYVDKAGVFSPSAEVFLQADLFGTHVVDYNADARHASYQGGKWGYVDDRGSQVIRPQFQNATEFSEGLAAVTVDEHGTCGYVDKTGTLIIPAIFHSCDSFADGLAAIEQFDATLGTSVGYIDKRGKTIFLSIATKK